MAEFKAGCRCTNWLLCRSGWAWAGFFLAALGFTCLAVLGQGVHESNLRLARSNIQLELSALASSASALIDVADHKRVVDQGGSDRVAYAQALAPLKKLQGPTDVTAVYTLVRKGGTIEFGYDTTPPGDNNQDGTEDHSPPGEVWDPATVPDAALRAFGEKRTTHDEGPTTDKWGTWISAYAPVLDTKGNVACVVGVDVPYSRFNQRLATVEGMKWGWLALSLVVSALAGAVGAMFLRKLGRSLQEAVQKQAEINARNQELDQLNQTLDLQARTDSLTGLLNRSALEEATYRALGNMATNPEWQVAVAFIDLDHFKLVNDSMGHEAGDALLVSVTKVLEQVAAGNTYGRFGGDEIMVVIEGDNAIDRAAALAQEILSQLANPIKVMGRVIYVTASVGIAAATGIDHSASDLIRRADAAMYAAKHRGRNQVAIYHTSMMEKVDNRLALEAGLRQGFKTSQLWIALQPIVDLRTDSIVACEALLRWTREDGSQVSPADFIPVAEENGLIVPIGEWILDSVVTLLEEWRDDPLLAEVRIAVNVSARQVCDPEFVSRVIKRLENSRVPGRLLTLEITETAVMNDHASLVDQLNQARAAGIQVALDDFGTGFSSLSMLVRTPIDILKIDKTFIVGLESDRRTNQMARSIVSLSQSMGMKVVAEGVEIPEHARHLLDFGCELAQGWLYAKAMPKDGFVEFVTRRANGQAA